MRRFFPAAFLFFGICFSPMIHAKQMGLEISYAPFMQADGQTYLELYFALASPTVDFAPAEGGYQGGVEIWVTLMDGDTILAADRFRLLSGAVADTANLPEAFIGQTRLEVPRGDYTMVIDLTDINQSDETYHLEQPIAIQISEEEPAASPVVFLDSYSPAKEGSDFAKSGYELVPKVSSGVQFFGENVDQLSFYTEIYHSDQAVGQDSAYVLRYYLRRAKSEKPLNAYASYSRKNASPVQPLLASFSINDLPTGNYELVVEALDKSGDQFFSSQTFFYRKGKTVEIDPTKLDAQTVENSFVGQLGGVDSLYKFLDYLYPISGDAERNYQKQLMAEADLDKMQQYFYSFWLGQNQENPAGAWQEYHKEVRFVNSKYGSGLRSGFRTDRGRVYLMYGKPSLVDIQQMNPNTVNYEIWQFNQISTPFAPPQTNKIFVFAEFQPSSQEYELFHSTAIGELQSRRWRYDLVQKGTGAGGDIDDDFNLGRDQPGSRVNNNIILDGTGADRDRR